MTSFNPPSCGQAGQPRSAPGRGGRIVSIRRRADRLASRKLSFPCRTRGPGFNPPSCGQAGQPGGQYPGASWWSVSIRRRADRLASRRSDFHTDARKARFNPPSCGQAGQPRDVHESYCGHVSIRRRADRLASHDIDTVAVDATFQSAVVRTGWPAWRHSRGVERSGFQSAVVRTGWPASSATPAIPSACPAMSGFNPPSCGQAGQPLPLHNTRPHWGFNPPSCGQAGQPHLLQIQEKQQEIYPEPELEGILGDPSPEHHVSNAVSLYIYCCISIFCRSF